MRGVTAAEAAAGNSHDPQTIGDGLSEVGVDIEQVADHAFANRREFAFAEFEHQRIGDVALLNQCLADVELAGLAVMVGKAFRAQPHLRAFGLLGKGLEALLGRFPRTADFRAPGIGLVIGPALRVLERHVPILLEMMERAFGRIDRQLGEVRASPGA